MPAQANVGTPVPCGHAEIAERFETVETALVFCSRCQRGYELPPRPDAAALDQRFLQEALAYSLL